MRLLNTRSLEFEEFFGSRTPEYAILSHRWGAKEVSYQQFSTERSRYRNVDEFREQYMDRSAFPGHWKILRFCRLADSNRFKWVWIDTCCIDKASSAELSEAINSMYQWYKEAGECYAYLSDVGPAVIDHKSSPLREGIFVNSKWFHRGWTLQELLAPSSLSFYDRAWNQIGTREARALEISGATGIDVRYLSLYEGGREDFTEASVAIRMSWISERVTSRIEDMAYCMLGIFGVNMPLLYGEGLKAFMRLQLEIIKKSDDESIFAWTDPTASFGARGMLAPWPTCFKASSDIWVDEKVESRLKARLPYSMTNKGLEFRTLIDYWVSDDGENEDTVIDVGLRCFRGLPDSPRSVTITLRKIGNHWERIDKRALIGRQFFYSDVRRGGSFPFGAAPEVVTLYIKQDGM